MEIFDYWFRERHKYAEEWKSKTGGKVIGYFCTYIPEELLYAANILPVRIFGSHDSRIVTLSEAHIYPTMYCPFCRDCLASGLAGKYKYLDGIVLGQSCLHMRQSYHTWAANIPVEFKHNLAIPHGVQNPEAVDHYLNEMLIFKGALEEWLGKEISMDKVREAVEVVNENRRLLRELYELRKREKPPILGHEVMKVVITSQFVDKREHNEALKKLLKEAKEVDRDVKVDARILITGSENDEVDFISHVEDLGMVVVIDEQCTGSRYFWNTVEVKDDIFRAIAERYVNRPPCPAKDWPERRRLDFIKQLAKEWNVQGALLIQQKFCMPHELDIPALKEMLEGEGIKTYHLEFDVTVPWGQFKTRVEAFYEELVGLEELL